MKRKSREMQVKPSIFIVCEGESEERYFKHYRPGSRKISIAIERFDSDLDGAIEKFERKMKYDGIKINENDRIYFVFDMDEKKEREEATKNILLKDRYNLSISIPTFELWILLHYTKWNVDNSTKEDIERKLKGYIKKYYHGLDVYPKISEYTEQAINRARKLLEGKNLTEEELYLSQANPITHVYKLVEILESERN